MGTVGFSNGHCLGAVRALLGHCMGTVPLAMSPFSPSPHTTPVALGRFWLRLGGVLGASRSHVGAMLAKKLIAGGLG